jgi:hypothetical protein
MKGIKLSLIAWNKATRSVNAQQRSPCPPMPGTFITQSRTAYNFAGLRTAHAPTGSSAGTAL